MVLGRVLLFVLAFFVIAGLTNKASAEMSLVSTCSYVLVSTPLCDELLKQTCLELPKEKILEKKSPVVVSLSKKTLSQTGSQIQAQTISQNATSKTGIIEPAQHANLDSNKIFNLVNQYRISQGLPPFELENRVCELAQARSAELAGEIANGTLHSGLYNRNLPYWIWENAKVGSNEEETVAWWLASPLHKQSIINDYKYSCVRCNGTYCSQLFTSFSPK